MATTHAGGVYDLGYRVVWCPKYRRPVLTGQVKDRCEELIRAKVAEHSWDVDIQCERPWRKTKAAHG
jgi:putative transposase